MVFYRILSGHDVGSSFNMRVSSAFILSGLILVNCGAGYHRVRYTEMPNPPTVIISGNEFIVTTHNTDGEGLSVYKVDINMRDRARIIELKGYQAVGKPKKTEFKISLSETQVTWIEHYKAYWLDPGGQKTPVQIKSK